IRDFHVTGVQTCALPIYPAPEAAAAPTSEGAPTPFPKPFRKLLLNTLVSGVTSSFLWFALTFWVYLETRSVVATGVIGGSFGLKIGRAGCRGRLTVSLQH